jgi:transcriptional regulator with XRE-family HTH domain
MADQNARPLAANLRRIRASAGLTVVELARRSGIGRATLTQLEAGSGNPTLETLYALANELRTPLADLIAGPPAADARVLRRGEGEAAEGAVVTARLLRRSQLPGAVTEIYALELRAEPIQYSEPHPSGTREHLHLHSGSVRVGPSAEPFDLGAGDYADYPADVPHLYQCRTATGASATLVITTPARAIHHA